jgi:UDP-2-acetamido-2-deoxy-ribo-hexuluronate aminotransferase
MTIPFIDLKTQYRALRDSILERVERVMEHGQFVMGPEVDELEERLASLVCARHCVTVASGTEALLIALMALGVGVGDEVITTPFSFIATAEMIVLLGARPVFVDVEPDTCNIDPSLIEERITGRTRAIIPVALYGQPANMDEINAVAERHGLPVIEDAAQSFGARYKGRRSGALSTIGCTSFFPSKPLGCYGDGGAMFMDDDQLAQACREIRVHGQSARYVHTRVGVGGRMDTIQCAILLAKLERFDWEIAERQARGSVYNVAFDEAGIERVTQRPDRTSVFAQYTLMSDDRDRILAALKERGIPTAVHYPVPMNKQPAYRAYGADTPVAERLAERVFSVPMSADITGEQQREVFDAVLAAARAAAA